MKVEIKSRWNSSTMFTADVDDKKANGNWRVALGLAVLAAVSQGAYLQGADLRGAYLRGAYLRGAYLRGAYLQGADLRGADLRGADLRGADLRGAYLRGADLQGADLRGADLRGAYLRGADLQGAYLRGAYLRGADLQGAQNADLAIAMTRILQEGTLIGWKKCRGGMIVKLEIPADAKRSHAHGRKCRASEAKVLEIFDSTGTAVKGGSATSDRDVTFIYRVGETVKPKNGFNEDMWNECSSGIHFFITRIEAENYIL